MTKAELFEALKDVPDSEELYVWNECGRSVRQLRLDGPPFDAAVLSGGKDMFGSPLACLLRLAKLDRSKKAYAALEKKPRVTVIL